MVRGSLSLALARLLRRARSLELSGDWGDRLRPLAGQASIRVACPSGSPKVQARVCSLGSYWRGFGRLFPLLLLLCCSCFSAPLHAGCPLLGHANLTAERGRGLREFWRREDTAQGRVIGTVTITGLTCCSLKSSLRADLPAWLRACPSRHFCQDPLLRLLSASGLCPAQMYQQTYEQNSPA